MAGALAASILKINTKAIVDQIDFTHPPSKLAKEYGHYLTSANQRRFSWVCASSNHSLALSVPVADYQRDGRLPSTARTAAILGVGNGSCVLRPKKVSLIRKAQLIEISLTDAPANPRALVQSREPVTAYDLLLQRVAAMTRLVQTLGANYA